MLHLFLILLLSVLLTALWFRITSPPAHLRHLPRGPFVASLLTFLSKPILEAMELVYWPTIFQSDFMTSWFLGSWWVVIGDPSIIKDILNDSSLGEKKLFTDLSPHALIGEYMGRNILYSKGAEWRKHRSVIGPAFHKDWPVDIFIRCTLEMLELIKNKGGDSMDVHSLFTAMTLDALGHAVLGADFGATRNPIDSPYTESYHRAARGVSNNIYFVFPFLERLPIPSRLRDREAVRKFRSLASDVLMQKKKEIKDGINKDDLLSRMLSAGKATLSDHEIINNTVVMFAAGHDTTANTLSFTLYHLSMNQQVQEMARNEIFDVLGDNLTPTAKEISRLVFLDAVILESMRMSPTLPQLRRELVRPMQLPNGTSLPEGTLVLLQTYSAMNHPKYWDRPTEFDPTRFLTLDSKTSAWTPNMASRSLFFGFGGGTRSCIGHTMAILEQRIALSIILRNYCLNLTINSPHKERLVTNQDPICRPLDLKIDFIPYLPSGTK